MARLSWETPVPERFILFWKVKALFSRVPIPEPVIVAERWPEPPTAPGRVWLSRGAIGSLFDSCGCASGLGISGCGFGSGWWDFVRVGPADSGAMCRFGEVGDWVAGGTSVGKTISPSASRTTVTFWPFCVRVSRCSGPLLRTSSVEAKAGDGETSGSAGVRFDIVMAWNRCNPILRFWAWREIVSYFGCSCPCWGFGLAQST